jgi:hypothetical protein
VHEYIVANDDYVLKAAHKVEVFGRDAGRHGRLQLLNGHLQIFVARDAVGKDGLLSAEADELAQDALILKRLQEHFLVVAKENAHDPPLAPAPRGVYHAAAVGAAIHQVAQQNDGRLRSTPRAVVGLNGGDEVPKEVGAAMDVADCIDALPVGDARSRGLRRGGE